jgi:fibro-slime domain-containing protein
MRPLSSVVASSIAALVLVSPLACSSGASSAEGLTPSSSPASSNAPPSSPSSGTPSSGAGNGPSGSFGPVADAGAHDANPSTPGTLTAIVRDFRVYDASNPTTNPDFENPPFNVGNDGQPSPGYKGSWYDTAIVTDLLGADGTPSYKPATGGTVTTHGASSFAQWYHDVPGTNVHVEYPLPLKPRGAGVYGYDSVTDGVPYDVPGTTGGGFFPIDDGSAYATPFGNQGMVHNYSFTVEIHTVFTYQGGEYFHFRGDDDVFVFIDEKLAIDLGGIHDPEEAEVAIDSLGLTVGQTYPLDFFFAERHVYGSNVEFTTTLALQPAPPK